MNIRPLLLLAVFLVLIGVLISLIGLLAELVLRSATFEKGYWVREVVGPRSSGADSPTAMSPSRPGARAGDELAAGRITHRGLG